MPLQESLLPAPPAGRVRMLASRLQLPLGMVLVGAFGGLLVSWLGHTHALNNAGTHGLFLGLVCPWVSMAHGILYTVVMWSTLLGAKKVAYRHIPLQCWSQFGLHVGFLTIAAFTVFAAIYSLDSYLCTVFHDDPTHHARPSFMAVATVAFVFTLVISTVMYAFDFYRRMRDAEQAALTSELKALRAQINPHFLFNTLNSIAALVRSRPAEAEGVTEQLADLFRYSLRASRQSTVTLGEEVEAVGLYVAIEQTRFRERLQVVLDVPLARERLRALLAETATAVEVVAEAGTGKQAVQFVHNLRPDLLFLDVQMPVLDGFDVLDLLTPPRPHVVFVTAYDAYALRAFEVHALDYLTKPVRLDGQGTEDTTGRDDSPYLDGIEPEPSR